MRILCLSLLFGVSVWASDITLEFLESKPKGLARDFYIWQFLSNDKTTLKEALKAYELIYRKTSKLNQLMAAKGKITELPRNLYCQRLGFQKLKKQDASCIKAGLSISSIPSMPQKDKDFLLKKFQNDPAYRKRIEILSKPNILTSMLLSDAGTFAGIYYGLTPAQRTQIINQKIKPAALKKLADQNVTSFNNMLQAILVTQDKSFVTFKESLVGANITGADSYTLFMLGINEVLHQQRNNALIYFKRSANKATTPMQKNRALFWQYRLSSDQKILEKLAQSTYVDLYTIYANQTLKQKPRYQVVSDLGKLSKEPPNFDIKDPFQWQLLRDNLSEVKSKSALKDLSKHFAYEESSPHYAYVLNQINQFKINYFITPFADKLKWKNDHERALTYAVAKQESTLLPALVSTSYALGMMQIMPFNVKPFAKSLKRNHIELEDMFNPITALEFGRFYLNDLGKEFKHPLFVSYAYNGGPGFLRRMLQSKTLFLKHRDYEPWLSMELVPYKESRDYGLRVLANYIVYQETFGNNINLEELLKQTLVN